MPDNVVRISDYERRSREADAAAPRDPCDATIIILPDPKTGRVDDHNEMLLARMRGAPAVAATPENERDPANPNVKP